MWLDAVDGSPTEVIANIARHLELRDLLRLSAVNTTCRHGCYDRGAMTEAIAKRQGGKLNRIELQLLLHVDRVAAAALSHQHHPMARYYPRGLYLYEPHVVASAMHTFGSNERVVSWKRPNPANFPYSHAHRRQRGWRRGHATPYADCSNLPKAASLTSSPDAPSPLPSGSWLSPSGCATPVM